MRSFATLLTLLPTLSVATSLTIYTTPVTSSSSSSLPPAPLLELEYDTITLTSSLKSYTPPKDITSSSALHKIGLFDAKEGSWNGVVTSAQSFAPEYQKLITVYVDDDGIAGHVSFSAVGRPAASSPKPKSTPKSKSKKSSETTVAPSDAEVVVEVVRRNEGPQPVLNKPVVLNAEGRVEGKVEEKSFIQKYWWAIALFLLVQLVAGGGGDGK